MTARQMVCACEDVSLRDVQAAIAAGHTDMESLKRFTGLATGLCQGRSCLARAAAALLAAGTPAASLMPTTQRPPARPVRLGVLATSGPLPPPYPSSKIPARTPPPGLPEPPGPLPPLPGEAAVVIVGGGIMSLCTAYHLARLGQRRVVVLERGYLNAGASGRNGGGVRTQWSTALNVEIMIESMRLCRSFSRELGINVWLRQGGYLFLARTPEVAAAFERNVALQNSLGVRTRLCTPQACRRIVPQLAVDDVLAATFNPDDGVIFPWPFLWGYAAAAKARGVHVATFTAATGIDMTGGRVHAVHTSRGSIRCDVVINAAAAWAGEVAALAGVSLPNHPERHEIMVTESIAPFLNPLVSELDSGLYFSQSLRGELVAGMGEPGEPPGVEIRSSSRFVARVSRALCRRMPHLSGVQLVRQWAGCYDVTPDRNPVVGEPPGAAGFFQLNGFVGHGFMMAPAIGRRVAAYLARGEADPILTAYSPRRFVGVDPATLPKETLIIG